MATIASSKRFQIDRLDIKSIGQAGFDGIIALVITILPMFVMGASYHFGHFDLTPIVLIGESLAVKALRKYLTDHGATPPPVDENSPQ